MFDDPFWGICYQLRLQFFLPGHILTLTRLSCMNKGKKTEDKKKLFIDFQFSFGSVGINNRKDRERLLL